jgi:hypothetical protein
MGRNPSSALLPLSATRRQHDDVIQAGNHRGNPLIKK